MSVGAQHAQHSYPAHHPVTMAMPGQPMPLMVPPGMMVQHPPAPPNSQQQPAVVIFPADGQPTGQPGGAQLVGMPHSGGQQAVPVVHIVPVHQLPPHQQQAFIPHAHYPPQQLHQAPATTHAPPPPPPLPIAVSAPPVSSACPPPLPVHPQHNGHAPNFAFAEPSSTANGTRLERTAATRQPPPGLSTPLGGEGPAASASAQPRIARVGSGALVHTSQEFVPRALQRALRQSRQAGAAAPPAADQLAGQAAPVADAVQASATASALPPVHPSPSAEVKPRSRLTETVGPRSL